MSWSLLPNELISQVVGYMDVATSLALSSVDKRTREAVRVDRRRTVNAYLRHFVDSEQAAYDLRQTMRAANAFFWGRQVAQFMMLRQQEDGKAEERMTVLAVSGDRKEMAFQIIDFFCSNGFRIVTCCHALEQVENSTSTRESQPLTRPPAEARRSAVDQCLQHATPSRRICSSLLSRAPRHGRRGFKSRLGKYRLTGTAVAPRDARERDEQKLGRISMDMWMAVSPRPSHGLLRSRPGEGWVTGGIAVSSWRGIPLLGGILHLEGILQVEGIPQLGVPENGRWRMALHLAAETGRGFLIVMLSALPVDASSNSTRALLSQGFTTRSYGVTSNARTP
ncbi:uncharacterized protein JN550_007924 [Neoarthrinium moseri]|uniref:uncharacterized protein n=1 Tax=Neoarthrinium moseri TaxID=1658444 RepID=UPI001FDCCB7B|nr:uncharacterized protein JN550_007924 [Neoarthrinium moseri]KAI1865946.1 hypothetical protein JN550_007924 [Neoarthrinium moseri]